VAAGRRVRACTHALNARQVAAGAWVQSTHPTTYDHPGHIRRALITSLHNPRVKAAVRLRDRRHREKQGRIRIDGARELLRAIQGGVPLVEAFVCESLCDSEDTRRVLGALPDCGAEILHVTEAVFNKLAFGDRADGVLGVATMPCPALSDLTLPENPLVAVLEGVEKPGNVGAVLRSGDAAGLSALVVADGRTDLYNPNAIRASLGTIFTLPVCTATAQETLDWLRRQGLVIYAARVDGSVIYTEVDYRGPAAVVLGSEAEGLSSVWMANDVTPIRLPMLGSADSLNVSATAAVLFYEALRQRSQQPGRIVAGQGSP
jgi:TrmH family RNA methyltransferase